MIENALKGQIKDSKRVGQWDDILRVEARWLKARLLWYFDRHPEIVLPSWYWNCHPRIEHAEAANEEFERGFARACDEGRGEEFMETGV